VSDDIFFTPVQRDNVGAAGATLLRDRGLADLCGPTDLPEGSHQVVRVGSSQVGEDVAVLFRREAVEAATWLDRSVRHPGDMDNWVQLHAQGPAFGIYDNQAAYQTSLRSGSDSLVREQGRHCAVVSEEVAADPTRGGSRSVVLVGRARARASTVLRRTFVPRHRSD